MQLCDFENGAKGTNSKSSLTTIPKIPWEWIWSDYGTRLVLSCHPLTLPIPTQKGQMTGLGPHPPPPLGGLKRTVVHKKHICTGLRNTGLEWSTWILQEGDLSKGEVLHILDLWPSLTLIRQNLRMDLLARHTSHRQCRMGVRPSFRFAFGWNRHMYTQIQHGSDPQDKATLQGKESWCLTIQAWPLKAGRYSVCSSKWTIPTKPCKMCIQHFLF